MTVPTDYGAYVIEKTVSVSQRLNDSLSMNCQTDSVNFDVL